AGKTGGGRGRGRGDGGSDGGPDAGGPDAGGPGAGGRRAMTQPWALLSREERIALVASSWRRAMPTLMVIVSAIGMVLPVFVPGPVLPHLPFVCVFYWSIHRPDLMPSWAAFLAGLAVDAVLSVPIGLNATLFTLF